MPTDHVARTQEQWRRERPDLDSTPSAVIGRLHRIAAMLTRELVAGYAAYGLTEGEFDVLATLRREGEPFELAPGDLAEHTMVTTGGMTKRLDRLAAAGLVSRRAAASDGRRRVVALTDAGRLRIDEAYTAHMATEARLLEPLGDEERAALETVFAAWLERVDEG